MNQLENWINRFIKLCFQEQQLRHSASFVSILSHSESELYSVCFFWITNSVRKILKNFESCSRSDELVGKPDYSVL